MPPWILITPSSRGIGLALSRRLLRQTTLPIVATTRSSPSELQGAILRTESNPPPADQADCVQPTYSMHVEAPREAESRLTCLTLDVTNEDSMRAASEECGKLFPSQKGSTSKNKDASGGDSNHLHLAFAIPGILRPEKSPAQLDSTAIHDQFNTNIIGPLLLLKHFSPLLPRKATPLPLTSQQTGDIIPAEHATWAAMSARVGSITDNQLGGWYSYRASKAGVNQMVKTFDNYMKTISGDKAVAVGLHPGSVKTGLSRDFWANVKKEKLFSAEYAAECLLSVVRERSAEGRGRCWDWSGAEVPP